MSKFSHLTTSQGNQASFLANSKPMVPGERRRLASEKRISDPSSSIPADKRYPIPAFFNYRFKPKEPDAL